MDQAPAAPPVTAPTIAIKLPALLQDRLLAYPILHLIRDAYPDAHLHFISPTHKIEMLYTLPFEGYWHPWEDEGENNVFEAHRFANQLKIQGADIYISFGDSAKELALGVFLGAKKRVGFGEGWKAWFNTLSVKRPIGHHRTEEYLELYKALSNLRLPNQLRVMGRELPPFYKPTIDEPKPYLAVDLYPFSPGKLDDFWVEYFSLYEDKRFVLFFGDEEAKGGLLAEHFIQRLPSKNRYDLFLNPNWIELGKMLAHSQGLVARSGATVTYATYLGVDALAIYESGDPRLDAPFYNFANWQLMDVRDPTKGDRVQNDGVLKHKPTVNPYALFDMTNQMFRF